MKFTTTTILNVYRLAARRAHPSPAAQRCNPEVMQMLERAFPELRVEFKAIAAEWGYYEIKGESRK